MLHAQRRRHVAQASGTLRQQTVQASGSGACTLAIPSHSFPTDSRRAGFADRQNTQVAPRGVPAWAAGRPASARSAAAQTPPAATGALTAAAPARAAARPAPPAARCARPAAPSPSGSPCRALPVTRCAAGPGWWHSTGPEVARHEPGSTACCCTSGVTLAAEPVQSRSSRNCQSLFEAQQCAHIDCAYTVMHCEPQLQGPHSGHAARTRKGGRTDTARSEQG